MRFRPERISVRPLDSEGRVVPGRVWRTLGWLEAAEDVGMAAAMPDDTETVLALAREFQVTVTFRDINPDVWRMCAGIPAGFPIWYVPPRLALEAAPERKALPWGDSAYTSIVTRRWCIGDPPDAAGAWWVMGPMTDRMPSGEGPRRAPVWWGRGMSTW